MNGRECDCCKKRKCNRIYKIPIGTPTKRVARVCGRCLTYNAQATRAWLDQQETLTK